MELGDSCQWFLLKFADDDFAIQYTGSDATTNFPSSMNGITQLFRS